MKNGWEVKELSAVSAISYGYTESASSEPVGPRFLRITDIQNDHVDWDDVPYCRIESGDVAKYRLASGDIVFARTGATTGKSFLVSEPPNAVFASYLIRLRLLNKKLLPKFLSLFFQTEGYWQSIKDGSSGSAQGGFNATKLGALCIPIPPLPEQHRIVGILDEALEGVASAKVNAEKNLKNARVLFESHLQSVFTQRGEGWEETSLGDAYDVRDGTHDSPKYQATGYPLVTSKNLKREGLSLDDVKLIREQDYKKINERSAVHEGDVLFAMIGTIGNPTLVTVEPDFAIKNVALFKIPSSQSGAFLKYYLDSGWVISKMMKEAKGTTQKFVGLGYLRTFPINVPPLSTQLEVVEDLDELTRETQRLESIYKRKLAALEALKKSLLHQAFSGEL
jgi:type I restriction enzyme S subunit